MYRIQKGGEEELLMVERLEGQLEHTQECEAAPRLKEYEYTIHPMVREYAREQLQKGIRTTQVLFDNYQLVDREFGGVADVGQYRLILESQVCCCRPRRNALRFCAFSVSDIH